VRLSAYRNKARPEIMIIPMIDIIFFLLVFYMMSTLYMSEQRNLAVQLPSAVHAPAQSASAVVVTLTADGTLTVNNEIVPIAELDKNIRQFVNQENVRVVIQADRNVSHGTVVSVLDQLRGGGIKNVSIAATTHGGASP